MKTLSKVALFLIYLLLGVLPKLMEGQNCSECSQIISTNISHLVQVSGSQVVCIDPGVECSGNFRMLGGTACNQGTISNLIIYNGAGIINNYGTIYCSLQDLVLNGNLTINNFPGGTIEFTHSDISLLFTNSDDSLKINNYIDASLSFNGSYSQVSNFVSIRNGIIWEEDEDNLNPAIFNTANFSVNEASLTIINSPHGTINVNGSINLNEAGLRHIENEGVVNICGSFNIDGDHYQNLNYVENKHTFNIGNSLSCFLNEGEFIFKNLPDDYGGMELNIEEHLVLSGVNNTLTNSSNIYVGGQAEIYSGYFENNARVNIDNTLFLSGGVMRNNDTTTVQSMVCSGSGTLSNNGRVKVAGDLDNTGHIEFRKGSLLLTLNYENTGSGSISGPELVGEEPNVTTNWPWIIVDGTSENRTIINGHLVFYDRTLIASEENIGVGFDIVSNNSSIGPNVTFVTVVLPGSPLTIQRICQSGQILSADFNVQAEEDTICPNIDVRINATFMASVLNFPNNYINTKPTYTLLPPGIHDSVIVVTPSVTTTYTAFIEFMGCIYSKTLTIFVHSIPHPLPTIHYDIPPYYADSTVSFPVTQTGAGGGYYSIQPSHPSVSIDSITGLITASGKSFGDYTVSYCISYSAAECGEFNYCANASISLIDKDQIVGCCFSNYGAAVMLADSATKVNVYCNLINELAQGDTVNTYNKGEFYNYTGRISVSLDWINNALNPLYLVKQGQTSFFGNEQKMKGVSSTFFNELYLHGNGVKIMKVDEYSSADIDFTSNCLDIGNYTFYMHDSSGANVYRTTGYAITSTNGYFSRIIHIAALYPNKEYLYPMGSPASASNPFRYRPIILINSDKSLQIQTNYMNIPPSISTDAEFAGAGNDISSKAPNIINVNPHYYHKIRKKGLPLNPYMSRAGNAVPDSIDITIRSYYSPNDGAYISLAEWRKNPTQTTDWWGGTTGPHSDFNVSTNILTHGLVYAASKGKNTFNKIPFILAYSGVYINTSNFGNSNSTNISVTAYPSAPGGGTPNGGGLGNTFGTGENSGNGGLGGNTILTPNPLPGDYVININSASSCDINDKIKFTIEPNGIIDPEKVEYGLAGSSNYLGKLSQELFHIDYLNTGIILKSSPDALLKKCLNSIIVKTSINNDFVYTSNDTIQVILPEVNSPASISFGNFMIYDDPQSSPVFTSSTNLISGVNTIRPTLSAGVYYFEFTVSGSFISTAETIKGQLIVR